MLGAVVPGTSLPDLESERRVQNRRTGVIKFYYLESARWANKMVLCSVTRAGYWSTDFCATHASLRIAASLLRCGGVRTSYWGLREFTQYAQSVSGGE